MAFTSNRRHAEGGETAVVNLKLGNRKIRLEFKEDINLTIDPKASEVCMEVLDKESSIPSNEDDRRDTGSLEIFTPESTATAKNRSGRFNPSSVHHAETTLEDEMTNQLIFERFDLGKKTFPTPEPKHIPDFLGKDREERCMAIVSVVQALFCLILCEYVHDLYMIYVSMIYVYDQYTRRKMIAFTKEDEYAKFRESEGKFALSSADVSTSMRYIMPNIHDVPKERKNDKLSFKERCKEESIPWNVSLSGYRPGTSPFKTDNEIPTKTEDLTMKLVNLVAETNVCTLAIQDIKSDDGIVNNGKNSLQGREETTVTSVLNKINTKDTTHRNTLSVSGNFHKSSNRALSALSKAVSVGRNKRSLVDAQELDIKALSSEIHNENYDNSEAVKYEAVPNHAPFSMGGLYETISMRRMTETVLAKSQQALKPCDEYIYTARSPQLPGMENQMKPEDPADGHVSTEVVPVIHIGGSSLMDGQHKHKPENKLFSSYTRDAHHKPVTEAVFAEETGTDTVDGILSGLPKHGIDILYKTTTATPLKQRTRRKKKVLFALRHEKQCKSKTELQGSTKVSAALLGKRGYLSIPKSPCLRIGKCLNMLNKSHNKTRRWLRIKAQHSYYQRKQFGIRNGMGVTTVSSPRLTQQKWLDTRRRNRKGMVVRFRNSQVIKKGNLPPPIASHSADPENYPLIRYTLPSKNPGESRGHIQPHKDDREESKTDHKCDYSSKINSNTFLSQCESGCYGNISNSEAREEKTAEVNISQGAQCNEFISEYEEQRTGSSGNVKSCTDCIGELMDHTGNSLDTIIVKEEILHLLRPDLHKSRLQTAYGLARHCLPHKKQWQIDHLMTPLYIAHETPVHNVVKELKAEGKKIGHMVEYFSHKDTKRQDILELILKIHPDCRFCCSCFSN